MAIKRHKERHYIMIKGSVQEEDITLVNIYALNTREPEDINTNRHKGRNRQEYKNSIRI